MKKFEFRLEALLKLRIRQEEEAQVKFSQALAAYQRENDKEQQLVKTIAQKTADFRGRQQEVLTIETLKNYHCFIDILKEELLRQCHVTKAAAAEKEICLAELQNAVKNRKLLEKLKEKQWQEYEQLVLQEEQAMLDEIGAQAYAKSALGSGDV